MSKGQAELEQIRAVLFGDRLVDIDALRAAHELQLNELRQRIVSLEALLEVKEQRTAFVTDSLPEAVGRSRSNNEFQDAFRPNVEDSIKNSARDDSAILAEALYPVLGPAVRKMVANMLTPESLKEGRTFQVEQLLLIERETGLVLAASATDEEKLEDADVVSGMMDAIRRFVQEAFDAEDHDGLRDLRVGDITVLVEWGPRAVLASVVRGVHDEEFREQSAVTLEHLHRVYAHELDHFSGDLEPFAGANAELSTFHGKTAARTNPSKLKALLPTILVVLVLIVAIVALVYWLTTR